MGDLKGRVKIQPSTEVEVPETHADLFCPVCQTVILHEFLNPNDPTRVRCGRCGGTRDLNAWDQEESEINLAGYAPNEEDES